MPTAVVVQAPKKVRKVRKVKKVKKTKKTKSKKVVEKPIEKSVEKGIEKEVVEKEIKKSVEKVVEKPMKKSFDKKNIRMDKFLSRFSESIRENILSELRNNICEDIDRISVNIGNKRRELCAADCCNARVHRKGEYSGCSRRYRVIILEDGKIMEKSNCSEGDWERYSSNPKNKKLCMTHAKKDKKDTTKRVYEKYGVMSEEFIEPCVEIQPHCIALVEDYSQGDVRQCRKYSLKGSDFCCLCVRDWNKVFEPAKKFGGGEGVVKRYHERFGTINNPVSWLNKYREYSRSKRRNVKRNILGNSVMYCDSNIDNETLNKQHEEALKKVIAKMNAEHEAKMSSRSNSEDVSDSDAEEQSEEEFEEVEESESESETEEEEEVLSDDACE